MIAAKDDDQVDPSLGEDIASVPIENLATWRLHHLELIQ
jgi:hypothetical protein